jgi:hypothetical protein
MAILGDGPIYIKRKTSFLDAIDENSSKELLPQ